MKIQQDRNTHELKPGSYLLDLGKRPGTFRPAGKRNLQQPQDKSALRDLITSY